MQPLQQFPVRYFDIALGPKGDLLNPAILEPLLRDIREKRVIAVMMGPPCTTFSIARNRTKVWRSVQHPLGVPGLLPHELQAVELGNQLMRVALRIVRACRRAQVPWLLENPMSSYMFKTDEMRRVMDSSMCCECNADICQYGTAWRKSTKFIGDIDFVDATAISLRCRGPRSICSRTHRSHLTLSGSGP